MKERDYEEKVWNSNSNGTVLSVSYTHLEAWIESAGGLPFICNRNYEYDTA